MACNWAKDGFRFSKHLDPRLLTPCVRPVSRPEQKGHGWQQHQEEGAMSWDGRSRQGSHGCNLQGVYVLKVSGDENGAEEPSRRRKYPSGRDIMKQEFPPIVCHMYCYHFYLNLHSTLYLRTTHDLPSNGSNACLGYNHVPIAAALKPSRDSEPSIFHRPLRQ